jgi:hypothetical protein
LDSNLEDKRFCTEWQQAFPDLNLLLISSSIEFWFVKFFPKYLNSSTLSKVLTFCILENTESRHLFTYATASVLKLTFLSSLNTNLSII